MQFLRSNTAVIVTVGPFYDKTDGVTIEGALTITNERITLTADTDAGSAPTLILDNITGATAATANDLNYITNTDAGLMQIELAAADVNRVGRMLLSITDAANHVPVFHEYFVLPAAIFDWLTGVIVPLPANVTTIAGSAVSVTTAQLGVNVVNAAGTAWASGAITAASIATDAIGAAELADGAITAATFAAGAIDATAIANGAIDAATFAAGAIDAAAIATDAIGDAELAADAVTAIQSGLATAAALDAVDNFVDTEVASIVTTLGAAGAGLTAVPWNASWDAEVQSEVADELAVAIADSVPADGSLPSVKQALYMIAQFLFEKSIASTTLTVNKADGTTALMTFTLSNDTNPTSITRAS